MAKIKRSISIDPCSEEKIQAHAKREGRSFPGMIEVMTKFYDECYLVFENTEKGLITDKTNYGSEEIKRSTSRNS